MKCEVIKKYFDPFDKQYHFPNETVYIKDKHLDSYKGYVNPVEAPKPLKAKEEPKPQPKPVAVETEPLPAYKIEPKPKPKKG